MSLREPIDYGIPAQTAAVARAAFPKGTPIMRMRDALGPIFFNSDFASLYHREGAPARSPARLALISIFQFAEGLSDAQAAQQVGARIDWKYALALPLTEPGIDASALVDFRARLITGNAEWVLFEAMLERVREEGLVAKRGRQRTDATHVLAAIRTLGRLECVGESFRFALNAVAEAAPVWLRRWIPSDWVTTYAAAFANYRLPEAKDERKALAEQIGHDGRWLLQHLDAPDTPAELSDLPAVRVLRQVWMQQFYAVSAEQPICWRTANDLPPSAQLICSPYDAEARFSSKRDTHWTGYKVHLTETCDATRPNLITDVLTTVATTPDSVVLADIQAALAERDLLPAEQLVDAGYVSADNLVTSQTQAIDLVGPARGAGGWQTRVEGGLTARQFQIAWAAKQVVCPAGKVSVGWTPGTGRRGQAQISVHFAASDCQGCPLRAQCVDSATRPRALMLLPQAQHAALQAARERQQHATYTAQYQPRAGIEGTISQGSRMADLHRSRYRGLVKTKLLHILIATALNFLRVAAWLMERPRATTRHSAVARLAFLPT